MNDSLEPLCPNGPERPQGSTSSTFPAAPSPELPALGADASSVATEAPPWGRKSPLKVIRAKCLDCCAGSAHEVKWCPATKCPAWYHRFGRPPATVARKSPELMDKDEVKRLGKLWTGKCPASSIT